MVARLERPLELLQGQGRQGKGGDCGRHSKADLTDTPGLTIRVLKHHLITGDHQSAERRILAAAGGVGSAVAVQLPGKLRLCH